MDSFQNQPAEVGVISANLFNPLEDRWCMTDWVERGVTRLCCLGDGSSAFKREVFEKVGYYDEDFFIFQHGADLSLLALDAGYQIAFDKDVIIDHYEKKAGLRKEFACYGMRNLIQLNVKHFSLRYFPLLLIRNFLSFLALPRKHGTVLAWYYGLKGCLAGWWRLPRAIKKRRVVSPAVQRLFIRQFVFNRFPGE